ncbi:MAG: hypothetical protein LBT31_05780 [Synergistaceae bacterium]|jgi:hypothetical protein|nr:hypothetical protein [Synergistaceae bacterium]
MEASHEFDFEICNSRITPIADELVKKYEELRHIDVSKILFLVNHKSGGSKKNIVLARTGRVPEKWRDVLFQLGACSYFYLIEFYGKTTACLDENQMTALLYRELRRIGPEGQIIAPDVHDWWQVLIGLGRHWFYPDVTCPNLLDDAVDWKKLMGNSYEAPRPTD